MPAMAKHDPVREQLALLLDWSHAHVSFDDAIRAMPVALRGRRPRGLHSVWEQVEHIRLCQRDILDFCRDKDYAEKKWPDDYWPASPLPRGASAWTQAVAAYRRDRKAFQRLAADTKLDLFAAIPHGTGQTYLREILLAADHAAYHIGQIVAVRRSLGIWP